MGVGRDSDNSQPINQAEYPELVMADGITRGRLRVTRAGIFDSREVLSEYHSRRRSVSLLVTLPGCPGEPCPGEVVYPQSLWISLFVTLAWLAWIGLLIIAYVAVDMIVRGMMQMAAAMS